MKVFGLFASIVFLLSASAYGVDDLFENLGSDVNNPAPLMVRARTADILFPLLQSARVGSEIGLNFFSDAEYIALVTKIERETTGKYTVIGHDATDIQNVFVASIFAGLVSVSFRDYANSTKFSVEYVNSSNSHVIRELGNNSQPDCSQEESDQAEEEEEGEGESEGEGGFSESILAVAPSRVVDVMFLYTLAALADFGSRAELFCRMKQRLVLMNQAFIDSEANSQVRLVHTAALDFDDTTNIIANGTFTGNATGWILGSGFCYSSCEGEGEGEGEDVIVASNASTTMRQLKANMATPWGNDLIYQITFTITNYAAGSIKVGTNTTYDEGTFTTNGTHVINMRADDNVNGLVFTGVGFSGTIDTIEAVGFLPIGNIRLGTATSETDTVANFVFSKLNGTNDQLELPQLRNWVGADLTCVWAGDGGGVAYVWNPEQTSQAILDNSEKWSFSRVNALGDEYHLSHELGHNFGGQHDCRQYRADIGHCPFLPADVPIDNAFGWSFEIADEERVHTIMGYPHSEFDTRIGRFSNPDVLFAGVATGTNPSGTPERCHSSQSGCNDGTNYVGANVAEVINNSVEALSMYRPRVTSLQIKRAGGEALMDVLSNGNCIIYGTLHEGANPLDIAGAGDEGDFLIKDIAGDPVARVSAASGDVYLKGEVVSEEDQGNLNDYADASSQEFLVKNPVNDVVAVISQAGDLHLLGKYVEYEWY